MPINCSPGRNVTSRDPDNSGTRYHLHLVSNMSLAACERRGLTAADSLSGLRAMGILIFALLCCSCAGRPLQGVLVPTAESAEGTSRIPLLIATTRQRATGDAGEMFNSERASTMSYAQIAVSIPPDEARKIGEIPMAGFSAGGSASQLCDRLSRVSGQAGFQRCPCRRCQNDPTKQSDDLRPWI